MDLTVCDLTVLRHAALKNQETADRLGISLRAVEVHWTTIFGKLGVANRPSAVIESLRQRVISLEEFV